MCEHGNVALTIFNVEERRNATPEDMMTDFFGARAMPWDKATPVHKADLVMDSANAL